MNHAERERLFLDLFQENKSRIHRLCFAYLNSPADIDDLFQDIMTNLWNALPSFRGDSHPNTWLYRIAVNTALLYRRRQRPSTPLPEIEPPDLSPSTHQHMEESERLATILRARGVACDVLNAKEDEADEYFNIPIATRTRILELFRNNGIHYIFAGHYHRNALAQTPGLEMVTTGPVGKPLGADSSGFRIVTVNKEKIQHHYYSLDSIPAVVSTK